MRRVQGGKNGNVLTVKDVDAEVVGGEYLNEPHKVETFRALMSTPAS